MRRFLCTAAALLIACLGFAFAFAATPVRQPISPIWWVSSNQSGYEVVAAGDTVYLHGNNLVLPPYVYLGGPKNGFAPVKSLKPGEVQFVVPDWPAGTYDIWLYQGAWSKCATQLTLGPPITYPNQVVAKAPSGGDDSPYLQGLFDNLGDPGDSTGGPGTTVTLQAGTYQLKTGLLLAGHWASKVHLIGQGKDKTIIKAIGPAVNGSDGLLNGTFSATISNLTVEGRGATFPNARCLRGCCRIFNVDVFTSNDQQTIFYDGGDSGRIVMQNCNITGTGIMSNGVKSAYIDNCNFYLDGSTEAGTVLWSAKNVHFTNNTAQDFKDHNGQRGRIIVFGFNCSNQYLENLRTFNLAGSMADSNCGEQILWDGDPGQSSISKVYIYNCSLQGNPAVTEGASCAFETWLPATDFYVNGLTVENTVSGFNLFQGTTGTIQNITAKNCQHAMQCFTGSVATIKNFTATGSKDKSLWIEGQIALTLDGCKLDAPIGIASQQGGAGGALHLVNSQITGSGTGIDASAAKLSVTLAGWSGIFGFKTANVTLPTPKPPF